MSRVAFVLYRQVYHYGQPITDQNGYDLGSRVALRLYQDRAVAEARLVDLMRVARRAANPFAVLNLEARERAHEAEGGFDNYEATQEASHARLLGLGLPWRSVPQADWEREDWESWYDAEAPHLTDDERAKVWALFDARPLYGIREVPLGDE